MMTAPAPTVCVGCDGDQVRGDLPCPSCCCVCCGDTTTTPPVCLPCDAADDTAFRRGQDR